MHQLRALESTKIPSPSTYFQLRKMSALSTGMFLLFSVLLLLHSASCLSAGQRCNKYASNDCDQGLACVAISVSSDIAFCERIEGCEIFGCNVESGDCVCRTETNCLASFNFTTMTECQNSLTEHQPCDLTTCPSLWCDPSLQYTPKGECCPVCPPPPIAVFSPNLAGCTEQDGTHYNAGETWKRDACVTCTCEDGIPLCSSESCALPDCNNPIRLPGHCCPVCPPAALAPPMVVIYPATRSNECHEGGKIYKDGESWFPDKNDLCKRGYCDEGEIFYFSRQCAAPECENPIYSVDACCPTCPDDKEKREVREASSPKSLRTARSDSTTSTEPIQCPLYHNDDILHEGESYCPIPHIVGVCSSSGEIVYSRHCEPVTCDNPVLGGRGTCDCPVCPGTVKHFKVAALLNMSLHEFAHNAREVNDMITSLVNESGLILNSSKVSEYNHKQMYIEMNVLTTNETATEDDVVGTVRNELESKPHMGLMVGLVADFADRKRSARSADSAPSNSDSVSSPTTRHSSTSTVLAVTASVCGVVASVVGAALLTTYIRRKQTTRKTITV